MFESTCPLHSPPLLDLSFIIITPCPQNQNESYINYHQHA